MFYSGLWAAVFLPEEKQMFILKKLSNRPLLAALIVFAVYMSIFIVPGLLSEPAPGDTGISGIEGVLGQWPIQLLFSLFFIIIITALGWWRKIGFVTPNPGGSKFIILPLLYVGLIFFANWTTAANPVEYFLEPGRLLQLLVFMMICLSVGFTEESMYRGILFFGLASKYSTLIAVIVSSVFFGVFHYVNLFTGAALVETNYQVLHAVAAGFMYAALRLRIGAIWVVMIFHALWDFMVFLGQSIGSHDAPAVAASIEPVQLVFIIGPPLLYGIFVYWRWKVWNETTTD